MSVQHASSSRIARNRPPHMIGLDQLRRGQFHACPGQGSDDRKGCTSSPFMFASQDMRLPPNPNRRSAPLTMVSTGGLGTACGSHKQSSSALLPCVGSDPCRTGDETCLKSWVSAKDMTKGRPPVIQGTPRGFCLRSTMQFGLFP
eukprot:144053-Hanusia_phi.AAC.10